MEITEIKVIEAKNPRRVDDDSILMDVLFAHIGEFIPFNASKNDTLDHGKRLYEDALRGIFGAVAPVDVDQRQRTAELVVTKGVIDSLNAIKTELSALRDADELGVITSSESVRYKELRLYNVEASRFINSTGPKGKPPKMPSLNRG